MSESEEIPVSQPTSAHDSAQTLVEELEVAVHNNAASQPADARDLALNVLALIAENLRRASAEQAARVRELLQVVEGKGYLEPDYWRGLAAAVRYQLDETRAFIQRRQRGETFTDTWGMDSEIVDIARPFATFLYRAWWRVTAEGLEHVPSVGRALLVGNSGAPLWDGAMVATAVLEDHPQPRLTRVLYPSWFAHVPFVAPALRALGQAQDNIDTTVQLLDTAQLVCAFPEGVAALGKPLRDRYHLNAFSSDFAVAALRTGAPIVPVALVGAEEAYPVLANAEPIAKLFNLPFFPITPTFPWLGLFGAVPLPTKWTIIAHAPIITASYGPDAANDPQTVAALVQQVRDTIQATLDARVAARVSVFTG